MQSIRIQKSKAAENAEYNLNHSNLYNLPSEMLDHIFSYLDISSMDDASKTCKRFYDILKDDLTYGLAFNCKFMQWQLQELEKLKREQKEFKKKIDNGIVNDANINWFSFHIYWGIATVFPLFIYSMGPSPSNNRIQLFQYSEATLARNKQLREIDDFFTRAFFTGITMFILIVAIYRRKELLRTYDATRINPYIINDLIILSSNFSIFFDVQFFQQIHLLTNSQIKNRFEQQIKKIENDIEEIAKYLQESNHEKTQLKAKDFDELEKRQAGLGHYAALACGLFSQRMSNETALKLNRKFEISKQREDEAKSNNNNNNNNNNNQSEKRIGKRRM